MAPCGWRRRWRTKRPSASWNCGSEASRRQPPAVRGGRELRAARAGARLGRGTALGGRDVRVRLGRAARVHPAHHQLACVPVAAHHLGGTRSGGQLAGAALRDRGASDQPTRTGAASAARATRHSRKPDDRRTSRGARHRAWRGAVLHRWGLLPVRGPALDQPAGTLRSWSHLYELAPGLEPGNLLFTRHRTEAGLAWHDEPVVIALPAGEMTGRST